MTDAYNIVYSSESLDDIRAIYLLPFQNYVVSIRNMYYCDS